VITTSQLAETIGRTIPSDKLWYSTWTIPKYYMFYVGFWQPQEKHNAKQTRRQGDLSQKGREVGRKTAVPISGGSKEST
jgi:hypothetical protein